MSRTLIIKTAITGVLALLLLVPLAAVESIVQERMDLRDGVVANIQQSSVTPQRVVGPILVVPFVKTSFDTVVNTKTGVAKRTPRVEEGQVMFLPEQLNVDTQVSTEKRYRGIYSALLYNSRNTFTGNFVVPENFGIDLPTPDGATFRWGEAVVVLGIDDPRGIRGKLQIAWNSVEHEFEGGTSTTPLPSGVNAPIGRLTPKASNYSFTIDLGLQGSEVLQIVPMGKETQFAMKSSWPHPSFIGQSLPESRSIGPAGFEAVWRTSQLATNVEQALQSCMGPTQSDCSSLFGKAIGVAFVNPVDVYLMLQRSAKYGFLFVVFTFVLFSLFELLKRLAIHPVQYALVGVALATFFLLLVALSEHISFAKAYAIASTSCVLLLGFYVSYVLKGLRRASGFSGALALLYGALYVLLQSEDMALLLGAILLFGILATIMLVTRRVDWYRLTAAAEPNQAKA